MGIILSLLGQNSGRTDDPDSVTGLTSRDKYLLRTSWENIRKDPVKNGCALLLLYFQKYPNEQNYFPFRNVSKEELATNKKFQAHCLSVINAVTSIVDNVNDTEILICILEKIGENHKRRQIKMQSFDNIKLVMLDLFATFMTKEQVQVWNKTLDVCFKLIGERLQ